jgi:hypothetical protein
MPPQQPMMMPVAHGAYMGDGYSILNSLDQIKIKQKFEVLEALTGFETQNEYNILDKNGVKLFKAKEESDCLQRQCLPGDCRAFEYYITHHVGPLAGQPFLHIVREFQCTMCCANRPVLNVYDAVTKECLGSIRDPWALCDMTFDIMDAAGQEIIKVDGSCCQLGLFCQCPCGPCENVEFDIKDTKSGELVGGVDKTFTLANLVSFADNDNYKVTFGKVKNPKYKAMLLALAIFIDMRYFEVKGNGQQGYH